MKKTLGGAVHFEQLTRTQPTVGVVKRMWNRRTRKLNGKAPMLDKTQYLGDNATQVGDDVASWTFWIASTLAWQKVCRS